MYMTTYHTGFCANLETIFKHELNIKGLRDVENIIDADFFGAGDVDKMVSGLLYIVAFYNNNLTFEITKGIDNFISKHPTKGFKYCGFADESSKENINCTKYIDDLNEQILTIKKL